MNKKKKNRGFTLIELLAVLVILTAIMGIALPSITSSLERTKTNQTESKQKRWISYAELFITDYKFAIYKNMATNDSCYISLNALKNSGYLTEDEITDSDGNRLTGYIIFKKDGSYTYQNSNVNIPPCSTYNGEPDSTSPTCTATKSGRSSSGVTITINCSDDISGCSEENTLVYKNVKSSSISSSSGYTQTVYTYTVYDKAGNSGSCTVGVTGVVQYIKQRANKCSKSCCSRTYGHKTCTSFKCCGVGKTEYNSSCSGSTNSDVVRCKVGAIYYE